MAFLTVSEIGKRGEGDFTLRKISFSQRKGQKIAVAGETGSGKSTLLRIIAGLLHADKGKVVFQNEVVGSPLDSLVPGHPRIAYLSQEFELPKFLLVRQVLTYANKLSDNDATSLYRLCRIDHLLGRKTDRLSGGEKQRIALARLLIGSPQLLLLDEPFSNLDRIHRDILKVIIENIRLRLGISLMLISHDPEDILSWADTIIILKDGSMVQQGSPEKIYRQPKDEYVASLFGRFSRFNRRSEFFRNLRAVSRGVPGKFVRPEDLKLVTNRMYGVQGKVVAIHYYGAHYDIVVECSGHQVFVRAGSADWQEGDRVFVAFSRR